MTKKYRIDLRLAEEEYQVLKSKKMMLNARTLTEAAKSCLFDNNYLDGFAKLLFDINQRVIRVQRQNYITLKLSEAMLTKISKLGRFPEKVPEINQRIIDQYFKVAKKEAEELYR